MSAWTAAPSGPELPVRGGSPLPSTDFELASSDTTANTGAGIGTGAGAGDYFSAEGMASMTEATVADLMRVTDFIHVERAHESIPGVTVGELAGPIWEVVQLSSVWRGRAAICACRNRQPAMPGLWEQGECHVPSR